MSPVDCEQLIKKKSTFESEIISARGFNSPSYEKASETNSREYWKMVLLEMKINVKLIPKTLGSKNREVRGETDPFFFHDRMRSALSNIKNVQRQLSGVFFFEGFP